nr:porin [uncultured Albidiferax sp.]
MITKKRMAVSIGVAFLAAPVLAQSSVTIYGVAEAQVGVWRNVVAAPVSASNVFGAALEPGRTTGFVPTGINAARLGFRGTEDLGGGMRASFALETLNNMATGSLGGARFFQRQSNLSLAGPFGEVKLGRSYTPWNDVVTSAAPGSGDNYDPYVRVWRIGGPSPLGSPVPTASGQLKGLSGAVGLNNEVGDPNSYAHVRMDNSVRYDTPKFGGLALSGQIGLGAGSGLAAQSYAASYESGPLKAGLAYYRQGTLSYYSPATQKYDLLSPTKSNLNTVTAALAYDFNVAKVYALAGQSRYDLVSLGQRAASKEWSLGVSVPLPNSFLLKASVAGSDTSAVAGKDIGASMELHYLLSKRTALYGAVARTKYDELLHGQKDRVGSVTAVGLRHFF